MNNIFKHEFTNNWRILFNCIFIGSLLFTGFSRSQHVHLQPPSTALKVLLINSYHYGYRQSDNVVRMIFQRLPAEIPDIDIRLEYMDTKRYDTPAHFKSFFRYLSQKYAQEAFDLIIVSDDHAFRFIQNYQDQLWPKIPVVFCGLNNFEPELLDGFPHFTGIIEKSDVEDNIRLIERIHPNAKYLYLINDNTLTGEALRKFEVKQIQEISHLKIRNLDGRQMNVEELLAALEDLPEEAIVIFQIWLRDKSYRTYTHEEVVPLISEHSSVPVYAFSENYLGYGIVGGKLFSGTVHGVDAADMALRILNGADPMDIPIQMDSHCIYKFDYRVMSRFNISEKKLPPKSLIINRPKSFYSRHKTVIWTALALVGFQALFIIYLLFNRMWRVKAEQALQREHNLLQALMDNLPDYIYFKDRQLRFIRNNKAHLVYFGLRRQEDILGKTDFDFFTEDFAKETYRDEQRIIETGEPLINKIEKLTKENASSIWVSATKVPIPDEFGNVNAIVGVSRDITEGVLAAEKIRTSLAEKEILLKEIHHRVKNNLQIITSLLNLQASNIKDEETLTVIKESCDRVRSIALIHEYLYKSKDIAHLDLKRYVQGLVNGLYQGYQNSKVKVMFDLHISDIPMGINLAVPCGLIITELISNALKHAFPSNHNNAKIKIQLDMNENEWVSLKVKDNGVGIPEDFDWKSVDSLGLKLVRILVRDQLDGELRFSRDKGTLIEICFPLESENG